MVVESLLTRIARRACARAMFFREESGFAVPPNRGGPDRLLYLHVPFCESLCPYCSFHRVTFDASLCMRYFRALRREIELYAERGYDFTGLYVGGGTPTIMIDELAETLAWAKKHFSIREISVETNPNHVTDQTAALLAEAGVNRLSVGVQSFDDTLLRAMGRYEKYGSGAEIQHRLAAIRGRFDTVNADMIFNFPTQGDETLRRDCTVLRDSGVDQVTYYPLMVSDSTRATVEATLGRVDYGREKRCYSLIVDELCQAFHAVSAWCFSRRDSMIDEYIVDYDEYAGLGSGSIGYFDGCCYANTFRIDEYCDRVMRNEIPVVGVRRFSRREQMRYDFLMKFFGLSVPGAFFRDKYGVSLLAALWKEILAFSLAGGIRYGNDVGQVTRRGRYFGVVMMREFFIAVNNFRDFFRGVKR